MLEAELDYGLRCTLMGHHNARPSYGDGGSLVYGQDQLAKITLGKTTHPIFDQDEVRDRKGGLNSLPRRRRWSIRALAAQELEFALQSLKQGPCGITLGIDDVGQYRKASLQSLFGGGLALQA